MNKMKTANTNPGNAKNMLSHSRQTAEDIRKNIFKIQGRMQGLRNQMDFVEIFSHFWPLPNMHSRMKRLENEMQGLNSQYQQYLNILQSLDRYGLQN